MYKSVILISIIAQNVVEGLEGLEEELELTWSKVSECYKNL